MRSVQLPDGNGMEMMMKEILTSRQNPRVRAVCALADKKTRRRERLFRLDGVKLLQEALMSEAEIEVIFVRTPENDAVSDLLRQAVSDGRIGQDIPVYVSEFVFEKLSEEKAPEGVLTVARQMENLHTSVGWEQVSVLPKERLLLAESLRDPGNLGTVMRSCAALGIDRLILTEDCAELYNPKTVRGAMGALFRLPTVTVAQADLPALISRLRSEGRRVWATALREDARKMGAFPLQSGDCFVIGNEGHGLSEAVVQACDGAVMIPMAEGNESLNAAAAAAICIWETVRASEVGN